METDWGSDMMNSVLEYEERNELLYVVDRKALSPQRVHWTMEIIMPTVERILACSVEENAGNFRYIIRCRWLRGIPDSLHASASCKLNWFQIVGR